jgi:hypothetical protein
VRKIACSSSSLNEKFMGALLARVQ